MRKMQGVLFSIAIVGMFATSGNADVCSTFDADFGGWTFASSPDFYWAASGGNPDGYVRFHDSGPAGNRAVAPVEFLGDWSALDGVGEISYDLRLSSMRICTDEIPPYEMLPFNIDIAGPGGSAEWNGDTPSGVFDWVRVVAPLVESEWTLTSGTWAELLADVTRLRIAVEIVETCAGGHLIGLDNVCLFASAGFWGVGNAEASASRDQSLTAASSFNSMASILIPIGAVVLLGVLRRKVKNPGRI